MSNSWLERLQEGTRLLFWSMLAAYLLPNVFGFIVPISGGSSSDLIWARLIFTLAILPVCFGVFIITVRCSRYDHGGFYNEAMRLACRVFASLEVLISIIVTVSSLIIGHRSTLENDYYLWVVSVLATVAVLMRLRLIAVYMGAISLGRSFASVTGAYLVLIFVDLLSSESSYREELVWIIGWTCLYALVWIWGLALVGRLRRRAATVVAGKCGHCEYNLTGNVSGVCPECGRKLLANGDGNKSVGEDVAK